MGGVFAVGGLAALSQMAGPGGSAKAPAPTAAAPATVAKDAAPALAAKPAPTKAAPADATAKAADPAANAAVTAPVTPEPAKPAPIAPAPVKAAPVAEAPAADAPPVAETSAEKPAADALAAKPVAASDAPAAPADAVAEVTAPLAPAAATGDAPSPAQPVPPATPEVADAPAVAAVAPAKPPVPPPTDAPSEVLLQAQQNGPAATPSVTTGQPAAETPAAPGVLLAEPAPGAADLPPPPPLTPEEEALLQPLPESEPTPPAAIAPAPVPDAGTMPEPAPAAQPEPVQTVEPAPALPTTPGLSDQATGVVTNRLPRIGAEPPAAEAEIPAAEAEILPAADDPDLPPLQRFARPYENAAGKPLYAILLVDDGATDVNRQELAALPLALSIVIDPLSDGAADRAAIWRAGGQEVVMAATGIPEGAAPSDLEQSFQELATRLPEAVAVIDPAGAVFQDNRPLATQVVPILAGQGRGLVTFDRGLNAADQVARRENLPATMIFRQLDAEGEDSPLIRRYLDRAAFKAAQEGEVAVIGALRPETVAAILEWSVEGRSSTVALAPVSALMAN